MGWKLWGPARLLGSATAAALAGYSVMTIVAIPAVVNAGNCKTMPTADVAITQSSAVGSVIASGVQSVIFTVTGEDAGPCNATGITLTDMFTAGAGAAITAVQVVSVNPSNISCGVSYQAVSCLPFKLSGPKDANTKNPGNVILTVSVSGSFYPPSSPPPALQSLATIAYADDTVPGDNISQGGFLFDGGDLLYQPDSAGQSTNLYVAPGGGAGGAEIEQGVAGPTCPSGVKCFGEKVLINSNDILDSGGLSLQQFTFNVPLVKGGPSNANSVVVLHEPDGTTQWQVVGPCTATNPPNPNPCVASIVRLKTASGVAYFQIIVDTEINGKWGF